MAKTELTREFVHDQYAPLNHKTPLHGTNLVRPGVASWVPEADQRRLAAYQILAAYRDNVARYMLPSNLTPDQIAKYREYGDADRLIVAAKGALLGDDQSIHVPDAADALDLPNDQAPPADAVRAQAALDYLLDWAEKEQLWLEVLDTEHDAVGLGDGVYTLQWDPEKNRARIRSYDPGFYFVPPDAIDSPDDFNKRHIAWEQPSADGKSVELHRLTWALEPILPARDPLSVAESLNFLETDSGDLVLQDGDRYEGGRIVRDYPWNVDDEGQQITSDVTCHFSHVVWNLKDVKGSLFDLRPDRGTPRVNTRDLRVDFIPVIHIPNTPARREHFGRSILTLIAQILDDLNATNTDLLESAALAGNATLVVKGGPAGVNAGPGALMELDEAGDAHYLDVSRNLDALIKARNVLKDDLAENSRVSKATLGRTDGSNTVSGLQLALSFSPTEQLVSEMRLVRAGKYPLLLKMVLRFAQAAGILDPGRTPVAEVLFGSFLPSDLAEAVKTVTELLQAKAISTLTGVRMLIAAGAPIDDAVEEVQRIQQENIDDAVKLVDATGNVGDAYALLGRTPAADPNAAPAE